MKNLIQLPSSTLLEDALQVMAKAHRFCQYENQQSSDLASNRYSCILVLEDNLLIGIVTEQYLLQLEGMRDRAVIDVSRHLRSSFRIADIIGRISGDEFACFTLTSDEETDLIPERLDQIMSNFNFSQQRLYKLSLLWPCKL